MFDGSRSWPRCGPALVPAVGWSSKRPDHAVNEMVFHQGDCQKKFTATAQVKGLQSASPRLNFPLLTSACNISVSTRQDT